MVGSREKSRLLKPFVLCMLSCLPRGVEACVPYEARSVVARVVVMQYENRSRWLAPSFLRCHPPPNEMTQQPSCDREAVCP